MVTPAHQGVDMSTPLTFLEVSSRLLSKGSHLIPAQSLLLALKILALVSWNLHPPHTERCCCDTPSEGRRGPDHPGSPSHLPGSQDMLAATEEAILWDLSLGVSLNAGHS